MTIRFDERLALSASPLLEARVSGRFGKVFSVAQTLVCGAEIQPQTEVCATYFGRKLLHNTTRIVYRA
jgi:hypothetical protein